jgi:hypothetical protein
MDFTPMGVKVFWRYVWSPLEKDGDAVNRFICHFE